MVRTVVLSAAGITLRPIRRQTIQIADLVSLEISEQVISINASTLQTLDHVLPPRLSQTGARKRLVMGSKEIATKGLPETAIRKPGQALSIRLDPNCACSRP